MSWNHRILASKEFHTNGESEIYFEIYFAIHEVYYDKNGVPDGYTANAIKVGSDTIEGIQWTIDKMQECLKKPILWAEPLFPQEYENC